jgi:5S rRNA maturation endonuclease (ribonuclease M5)
MQLSEITARLKGVKGGGSRYQALCPAHNDKAPSLSISESGGKILLHCHAGCPTERIVAALGLEMKDLYAADKPGYAGSSAKPKREPAAVYDYKDMDGNIVHSTVRYAPKDFRQRRPDPNSPGGYIWKDVFNGVTPILYNLQAVAQAIKDGRPVLVVEGEKDCESLAKLGFTATTCPMGAGKWRGHYSDALKGGVIYIVADNDEPGRSHAKSAAKSLAGKAEEIYLIDLTAAVPESMTELPGGWDITDLINATPQEKRKTVIAELIANSTEYGGGDGAEHDGGRPGKKTAAEMLLNLVEATEAGFFHSEIKELYATIPVNNHMEALPLSGRDFEI